MTSGTAAASRPLPEPDYQIDCLIESDAWGGADDSLVLAARSAASAALRHAAGEAGLAGGVAAELTLVFSDDAAVRILNAQWRGQDRPTNVLSFPNATQDEIARARPAGPPLLLGDVVLALGTCQREAVEQGKDLAQHVAHLAIHGVLHLFGHDHHHDEEAGRMEALEVALLAGFGIADPYQLSAICAEDA